MFHRKHSGYVMQSILDLFYVMILCVICYTLCGRGAKCWSMVPSIVGGCDVKHCGSMVQSIVGGCDVKHCGSMVQSIVEL